MHRQREILTLMTTFFFFFSSAISQSPGYTVKPFQLNRYFWWSSSAPFSKAINDLTPEVIPDMQLILEHAERIENIVMKSLTGPVLSRPDDSVQLCSKRIPRFWPNSLQIGFGVIGLLAPPSNCAVEIRGVNLYPGNDPGYTMDELYEAVFNRGAAVKRRIRQIATRLINNFTKPDTPFNFTFDTASVRCRQSPACFVRQGDTWYSALSLLSSGINDFTKDGEQMSIIEYVRVANGKLGDGPLLRLPVYDEGDIERVIRNDTTTYIQRWGSNPNPSCFKEVPMQENPAVLDALDKAEFSAQLAEDAMTKSNLAILVLPLGLNIVPVALFADVSTATMLIYLVLSDFLTVIPLSIKGVELMLIGRDRYRSVVTWMSSQGIGNGTKPNAAGCEIFAAECRVRDEVFNTGLTLVIVSVVFLSVGVVSEVLARRYARKRRRVAGWWRFIKPPDSYTDESMESLEKGWGLKAGRYTEYVGAGGEQLERYSVD